ncbi:hypothetical protein CUMW_263150, partial [Citrus unshiu]
MEGENTKPKILIFGGTGYLGKYMVKASVASGHKTFVYARPVTQNSRTSKVEIHKEFQGIGVTIIEGELDEHEKIVSVLKEVDVVISTVAYPQFLDQLKIVDAIKVAGNIKRFLPSEFGCEEDRVRPLPPFEACLETKRIVRRAIEAAQIPYTFVSANLCGAYFANVLLRPSESHDDVVVYGSGEAKAVFNYEEDIAKCTIKTGWNFKRVHVSEEELVKLSETLSPPEDIPISIIHSALAKGDLMNFELGEDDIEASMLYPDFKFTTIDQLLDIFLIDPPKPAQMEGENTKPKKLIFGGTGYLGKYMVKASVSSGHKTFVYARPVTQNSRPSKLEIHKEFQGIGVTIIEGELDEHKKIVSILKEVDVVISTVAYPQFLDQLEIVHAIKVAGNIKRFLPSEFGCEEDRVRPLPPFEAYLEKKRIVRRAIEAAQIPYTFVSANLCGAYFVNVLLRPFESHDDVVVYGSGEAK